MADRITDIGYVTLRTPDLEASVRHYVQILGLRELARRDGRVYLTHGPARHCIELVQGDAPGVERIAFLTPTVAGLEELHKRLVKDGVRIRAETVDAPGITAGLSFDGPHQHPFDVVVPAPAKDVRNGLAVRGEGYPSQGVRPHRLGHVTLQTSDVETDVGQVGQHLLQFAISDEVVGEFDNRWMVFLRCNNDHHSLAFMKGADALHHIAFEVPGVGELVRLADRLFEEGKSILWGPGRHGAGDNIAIYHLDPGGTVVEYYTDMQRIMDDNWTARRWALDDYHFNNQWGGPMPPRELIDAITPLTSPEA